MRKIVVCADSQILIDLKERGDNALEETREIIREMTRHVEAVKRDLGIAIRGRVAR